MRADLTGLILFLSAIGLLIVGILFGDEIFPNPFITWSIRIIGVLIIVAIIALHRRKKLENL